MKIKNSVYLLFLLIIVAGCDECKDIRCIDIPNAYFRFNLIDAQSGEDQIFGTNPINHPDSIQILAQNQAFVEANKTNESLGFRVLDDTFFIKPDRTVEINVPEHYDTVYFEFQSRGMGECCEEFEITKVYYNGQEYNGQEGNVWQIKR